MKSLEELIKDQEELLVSIKSVEKKISQSIREMQVLKTYTSKKATFKERVKESIEKNINSTLVTKKIRGNQYKILKLDDKEIVILHKISSFSDHKSTETNWFTVNAASKDIIDYALFSLETKDSEIINIIMNKEEYLFFLNNYLIMSDGRINIGFYNDGISAKSSVGNINFTSHINDYKKINSLMY